MYGAIKSSANQVPRQRLKKASTRITDILGYSHDASHFLLRPQAIYTPDNNDEIVEIFKLAGQAGIGVTFRSGGTSLSGQSSTDGFLVDTRKNFRAISVGSNGETVTASPGATVRAVNAALVRHKRKLGPDPASEVACTIGGVVANNSSGMCCGTEQNTYRTIESMVLILPSGLLIDTGAADADTQLKAKAPDIHAGLIALRDRVRSNPASVETIRKLFSIKNTMGYAVNALVDFDSPVKILEHLVVGSEGTLAFIAQATFKTVPSYAHIATGLLVFKDLAEATRALPDLVRAGFAAIELMDSTSLRVAQSDVEATSELKSISVREHAALLVEFQEPSEQELNEKVVIAAALFAGLPLEQPAEMTTDIKLRNQLWHIRKGLYASVASKRPTGTTALLEDIAVPVDHMLETCQELQALFLKHGYEDSVIFGHARDGNIHFMLNEDFNNPNKLARYLTFTEEMVNLVLAQSGTLKAEHGTGRMMAPYVRRQYGDELYDVMWEIKRLIDPAQILNPGIIMSDNPKIHHENLKSSPEIEAVANSCVECGYCEPVCPSKDLTLTPRTRIVMRRELQIARDAGDSATAKAISAAFAYDGEDTCAVDGMCATTCPLSINTGSLVRELRTQSANPLFTQLWTLAANNWSIFTASTALALKGLSLTPFMRQYPTGGSVRTSNKVDSPDAIFFPSCVGTLFGTSDSAQAFEKLAVRAGLSLAIPEAISSMCCGTPWKSKGYQRGYEIMQMRVKKAIAQSTAGKSIPIVSDASSCSHGLAELLAADNGLQVMDSVEFAEKFLLPRLTISHQAKSITLHPTCSTTALGINTALNTIASRISSEVFIPENWGCCGFAGDRGFTFPELTESATMMQASEITARHDDYYVSSNRTCEIGMTRATGKQYLHIIEVLEELSR